MGLMRSRCLRLVAGVVHDLVCHPLIAVSGGSHWAHRFHDLVGVVWASPDPAKSVVLRGEGPVFMRAVQVLSDNGYTVTDHKARRVPPDRVHDVAHMMPVGAIAAAERAERGEPGA